MRDRTRTVGSLDIDRHLAQFGDGPVETIVTGCPGSGINAHYISGTGVLVLRCAGCGEVRLTVQLAPTVEVENKAPLESDA